MSKPSTTITLPSRIRVVDAYRSVSTTHGELIAEGEYDFTDPRLFGLGKFLVDSGRANVIQTHSVAVTGSEPDDAAPVAPSSVYAQMPAADLSQLTVDDYAGMTDGDLRAVAQRRGILPVGDIQRKELVMRLLTTDDHAGRAVTAGSVRGETVPPVVPQASAQNSREFGLNTTARDAGGGDPSLKLDVTAAVPEVTPSGEPLQAATGDTSTPPNAVGGVARSPAGASPDYEALTVDDLIALAKQRGIALAGKSRKADVIAALQAADRA